MTRFAAIETGNTAPLIAAMGESCDVVSLNGIRSRQKPLNAIRAIASRNAARRAIRYPGLFGLAPIKAAYQALYQRKITRQFQSIHTELKADRDRTALVFNGFLAPNALLDAAANDLAMNRLYVENGFFPGTLQADISGINGLSTLPRDAAFYDRLSDDEKGAGWPLDFEVRKSKIPAQDGDAALPEDFIFVPFQVPSDMQILALSPWIKDMRHLYDEIAKVARDRPKTNFVIKEHPSFPLSIRGKVTASPNIHFANHAVTHDLIAASEAVLTVNSTVGLEALVLGKKVITLGNAHYAIDGLTLTAGNGTQLADTIDAFPTWEPNVARREAFVRFVYNRFLITGTRSAPTAATVDALKARAVGEDAYSHILERHRHASPSD